MRYNIQRKQNGIDSTRMEIPPAVNRAKSALPTSSGTVLDMAGGIASDMTKVRGVTVTSESDSFEPSGLMGSGIYDEPLTLSSSRMMDWARNTTPVESEPDVTDWMVPAKAYVANLKARANEYARAGSALTVAAGDPYTPGVKNGQMAFKSERGQTVSENGEANIIAGDKNFSINAPGNGVIASENLLGWAAANNIQNEQWVGSLMSVEELTNNPGQPIGFPTVGDNTGPLFVGHTPSRPSFIQRVTTTVQSNKAQDLNIKLRSSQDYTVTLNSFTKSIPKGESTLSFRTFAPTLNPLVAEIMPEDGTQAVLGEYTVRP
ncbi:MAG: hypothetical protein J07AB43_01210 [Candidatus Nanosalina sp. J07AB43]|jgi:hypothetical protein|nr:MAG: hypothetical protein J07AB43_01210 [Candidatus Nanosalina sp. J07AB43]